MKLYNLRQIYIEKDKFLSLWYYLLQHKLLTMKSILFTFMVCLLSSCTSVRQTQIPSDHAQNEYAARYLALIDDIETGPVLTKITELRQFVVLTIRNQSHAIAEETLTHGAFEAIEAIDWMTCLDIVDELLAMNYASLNGHYTAMVCQLESDDAAQSQYHESVMNQLLEAVWLTGNGESLETAFQVINRAERDAFIEFHGLEFIKHSVTRLDGQDYEVVTLYDARKDETFEWYFTQYQ